MKGALPAMPDRAGGLRPEPRTASQSIRTHIASAIPHDEPEPSVIPLTEAFKRLRHWLDKEDATHWGQFERDLDEVLEAVEALHG